MFFARTFDTVQDAAEDALKVITQNSAIAHIYRVEGNKWSWGYFTGGTWAVYPTGVFFYFDGNRYWQVGKAETKNGASVIRYGVFTHELPNEVKDGAYFIYVVDYDPNTGKEIGKGVWQLWETKTK